MTKVKSIIILFIAVAGAFLIYHHFDKKEEDVVVKNKFASLKLKEYVDCLT